MARRGLTLALLALLAVLVAVFWSDILLLLALEEDRQHHQQGGESAGVSIDASDDTPGEDEDVALASAATEVGGVEEEEEGLASCVLPAAKRVVAIGDLHGDLGKARRALALAGLVDPETLDWVGGETVAVQMGDILDRGDEEVAIFELLEKLKAQAKRAGGALHVLLGNHDVMNVDGDFRYVTRGAYEESARWAMAAGETPKDSMKRTRYALMRPGGAIAKRFMAPNPLVVVVGSTVFAHGGLHPSHVRYGLDRMNGETRSWIEGTGERKALWFLNAKEAVIWSRVYSVQGKEECTMLEKTLQMIEGSVQRLVVGHTVQQPMGINGACSDQVYRIDIGMSSGMYDAEPEILEIIDDGREVRKVTFQSNAPSAQVLAKHITT